MFWGITPSLVGKGRVSSLVVCAKRVPSGKKVGKIPKNVVSAQPETSLQPNPQCFLPFAPF